MYKLIKKLIQLIRYYQADKKAISFLKKLANQSRILKTGKRK